MKRKIEENKRSFTFGENLNLYVPDRDKCKLYPVINQKVFDLFYREMEKDPSLLCNETFISNFIKIFEEQNKLYNNYNKED